MDIETGETDEFIQFDPDGLPGDNWLHRVAEFDHNLGWDEVVDHYALPESDSYEVRVVEVPPGESLRLGDVAAMHGHSGGGDLVEVLDHDSIPDAWIVDRMTLSAYLDQESGHWIWNLLP